jgi:DNA-binding NtrC family response regulator
MSGIATSVIVLAILPALEDRTALDQIFSRSHWKLRTVEGLSNAASLVDDPGVGVVISDSHLADARWQDVLQQLQRRRVEPSLIVASRRADDGLWAEALNLGACDVLPIPFEAEEVTRSVSLAWRQWRDKLRTPGPPS